MSIKVNFVTSSKLVCLDTLCEGETFLYGESLYITLNSCTDDKILCLRIASGTCSVSQRTVSAHAMVEPVDITIKVEMK